jgi:mannan endo-1,4-beta-mannosidase
MSRARQIIAILAILVDIVVFGSSEAIRADEPANFLTRRGDQLFDGDRRFRFVSFNIPNLLVIEDAYQFTQPDPWRWPNEFEIEDALESIRQMGGQVVRTYVLSVRREGSDMGDRVHVRAPGEFNEEGFRALDKVIEIARRKGIRVMIPFVDQHKWWGGIAEYAAFRGKPADAFWTDRQVIADFKATIRHLVTRKNTYTGVAYRDEPAIFGWETGNEIDSTPEWTREIAAFIKELDSNHLVIDGKSLKEVPVWSLDDPNIDVLSTHHYPWGDDHDYVRPIRAAHALTKGKKAYFVGEFGFVETPHLRNAIQAVVDDGISGALLWSLRFHRREGGFYWHMEVGTGQNIYKAYHWPGFESGERYDERMVLNLMRDKAFEIRGLKPPPRTPPAPPRLLPIDRPSAISWQGSAGATAYDIWRATAAGRKWQKIATAVSDAEVQYRPLFNDDTVVPGREYLYRVIARNEAGLSDPSNAVGPVAVECRTIVDECRDRALIDSISGRVSIATENARTVQEDCHRLAIPPGSAVTYRVTGPVRQWRVFSFSREEDARLEFDVSSDGRTFRPIDCTRTAFPSAQSVYGYLTPVKFSGHPASNDARYLRIGISDSHEAGSKVERKQVPLEIGRVEIDYVPGTDDAVPPAAQDAAQPAPLSAAVFVYGPRSIENALASIDAAAKRGDRRLNVVVTVFVDLSEDLLIRSYGRLDGPARGYRPYDMAARRELQESLRKVFARMVAHDMEIFILPHIDAGGDVHAWRNWVDFDPLVSHAGNSYDELMIHTIVDALRATIDDDTHVELALSGEMGTSLFRYAKSYRRIIRRLRLEPELERLKIGVSFNHNGIAGEGSPSGVDGIRLSNEQRQQMQSLIDESDFVGMSFYRPVRVSPLAADFVRGIEHFIGEFRKHQLTVPTSKPMHFSEVGIGGGHDGRVTNDPAEAVQSPWEGTSNPQENPWQHEPMRDLRRQFHKALLDFLSQQPAPWRVSAAFLWSTGTWDPQGMQNREFADGQIMEAITLHNRATAASDP